jgi:cardiolipin synthase
MEHLMSRVSGRPICEGNRLGLLKNGEQAYPAMLAAIDQAQDTVGLCTYIFGNDPVGESFTLALKRAVERGVAVRVLVDGVGALYSWPTPQRRLRRAGVPVASFHVSFDPWSITTFNLRNHRKLLVVDGRVGFVGGMNLRSHHLVETSPHPTRDLMIRVEGPAVGQLVDVFAGDWRFAAGEALSWRCPSSERGPVRARVLPDGPDEDFDVARWTFLGAIATATASVRVVTPYFLPEEDLLTALETAALRGVAVDLVLPARSNLPYLDWASHSELPRLVARGVAVWWSPAPFDHTKLLVVDGCWAWAGSANWDARSLRLNFELGIEAYDKTFAQCCSDHVDRLIAESTRVVSIERGLAVRFRDGWFRLFRPYL